MKQQQSFPKPQIKEDVLDKMHIYTIVDCALLEETFYHNTIKNKRITAKSLFDGTPHTKSVAAGPLLIQLDLEKNQDLIEALQNIETQHPAVIWLWSEKDFKPLSADLKTLLFGELENGKKMFFRFFDPRNLEGMMEIYKESPQVQKTLANIAAWVYKKNGQYLYL